jgi:hypothetical protein
VEKKNMQYKVMEGARVLGVGATAEEAIAAAASKLKLPADMDITPLAVVENLLANGELELVATTYTLFYSILGLGPVTF